MAKTSEPERPFLLGSFDGCLWAKLRAGGWAWSCDMPAMQLMLRISENFRGQAKAQAAVEADFSVQAPEQLPPGLHALWRPVLDGRRQAMRGSWRFHSPNMFRLFGRIGDCCKSTPVESIDILVTHGPAICQQPAASWGLHPQASAASEAYGICDLSSEHERQGCRRRNVLVRLTRSAGPGKMGGRPLLEVRRF